MKVASGVFVVLLLLHGPTPAFARGSSPSAPAHANTVLAQAGPSPSQPTGSPTASPSPTAGDDRGGITTGAGLVIAAILLGGLLLMRSRLLRR